MKKLLIIVLALLPQFAYPIYFNHIGVNDGLAQLSVVSIYQDELGRIWFGTNEGISVLDGKQIVTYKSYQSTYDKTEVINLSNQVETITADKHQNIYFRIDHALVVYEMRKQRFSYIHKEKVSALAAIDGDIWYAKSDSIFRYDYNEQSSRYWGELKGRNITVMYKTSDSLLWVGTSSGLYKIDRQNNIEPVIHKKDISSIFSSSKGDLWIACRLQGMYKISADGQVKEYLHNPNDPNSIANNQVRTFMEDDDGDIWIGTFKGLQKMNPETETFLTYEQREGKGGLSHSSIFSLYKDRQGTIWIGTYYGGVNYFNPKTDVFTYYAYAADSEYGLSFNFVGNMVEDKGGNLWICTEGGGLNKLHRKTGRITHFLAGHSPNSIAHNNLKSICYDTKRDAIYVGTHMGGLSKYDIRSKRFTNYLHSKNTNAPNEVVHKVAIYNDTLFVLARNGMFAMDMDNGIFNRYTFGKAKSTIYGTNFLFDRNGSLWVVMPTMLLRLASHGHETVEFYNYGKNGLKEYRINNLIETKSGQIFISSPGGGFYEFDETNKTFIPYNTSNCLLLSDFCYSLAETRDGNLVILTDKGISIFNKEEREIIESFKFGHGGLPISATHGNCGLFVTSDDEMYIGGIDGMVSVYKHMLRTYSIPHEIYFSSFIVSNKTVTPGDDTGILHESISYSHDVTLNHTQNNCAFNFSSNNYIGMSNTTIYEYMLEGFDSKWIETMGHEIYYTNLLPGKYKLKVREKSNKKGDYFNEISLNIKVKAPFYATPLAFICYFLFSSAIIIAFVRNRYIKLKLSASLATEKKSKEQIEELNQSKLRFFTNISHEFRTPLTLIASQVDMLLQNASLPPLAYNKILKVYHQTQHLRNLIDELLDFRKFDQKHATLVVSNQNIVSFVKEIFLSFYELAQSNEMTYEFTSQSDYVSCFFEAKQMKKVFNNLITNAFKYTPKRGSIEVTVSATDTDILISVIDSGIGIEKDDLIRIFDRFYQTDNSASIISPGTGIGLALAKHIVELHGGALTAKSRPGYGSIFTVRLKAGQQHFECNPAVSIKEHQSEDVIPDSFPDHLFIEKINETEPLITGVEDKKIGSDDKRLVLIVEDNEELLYVLRDLFEPLYKVVLARNGEEGLKKINEEMPDLVLSDVMMPKMSGTEMCMRIKNNFNTAHIPVILLSALNSMEQNVDGFQHGADDYIEKPFDAKLLLIRCNNIVRNRRLLKNVYQNKPEFEFEASLVATNQQDQHFMKKVESVINQHLSNPEFDVTLLARELALGRSTLFAKFKGLAGMTPNEFILSYKFSKASQLLKENNELQIVDISDMLGFSSPRYFSKCFKEQYGISPQEYRRKSRT